MKNQQADKLFNLYRALPAKGKQAVSDSAWEDFYAADDAPAHFWREIESARKAIFAADTLAEMDAANAAYDAAKKALRAYQRAQEVDALKGILREAYIALGWRLPAWI